MSKKKRIFVKGMAVMLAIIFFACKEEVPVTGVKPDRTALALTVGETAVLTATVTPANATVQTVTWSVDSEGIVTLKADGTGCTVTAVGAGTATVTVTTADGGKTAQCAVTVNEKPIPVSGVTLDQTALTLTFEETTVLTATVTPAEATVQTVSWSVDSEGVVELNVDGNRCTVTPLRNGTVTVTASVESFKADCTIESRVYIENTAFIAAVGEQCQWIKEENGTVKLTKENRAAMAKVGSLTIESPDVTDLSGIEYFTGLTDLICRYTQLTELNVSGCKNLRKLICYSNQLTTLNVSGCANLTNLQCYSNQLKDLDVSGRTSLQFFDCSGNQLTELDVSDCTNLAWLECYDNRLMSLDVSDCMKLMSLNCYDNQLISLNVSGCMNLASLNCYNNQLTSLDVSACTSLQFLDCSFNRLKGMDVSGCANLTRLYCGNNQLTSLDLSACTSLTELICGNQTSDGVNSQTLTLTLTTDQKIMWDNNWKNDNTDVIVAP